MMSITSYQIIKTKLVSPDVAPESVYRGGVISRLVQPKFRSRKITNVILQALAPLH
jgi:hypothetical protein